MTVNTNSAGIIEGFYSYDQSQYYNLTYNNASNNYTSIIGPNNMVYDLYNYSSSAEPTQIYYVYYDQNGWPYYIQGDGGYRYYRHEFFTGPFDYTINDCSAQRNSTSAYTDAFLTSVYENTAYISTGGNNSYHYVWLSSCDGVNYFYNNENGWSWRMKAFRNTQG